MVAVARGDYEQAIALREEGLALAREVVDSEIGENFTTNLSLLLGAIAFLGQGDFQRARAFSKEGLELYRQLKLIATLTIYHLQVAAAVAGSQGQPVRSARLWGAVESLHEAIGSTISPLERHFYGPYIAAARAQLGEAAWEAAWAEGKAMSLDEAVKYALKEDNRA
jgi:non-specific serine/threonine protein kinase